MKSHSIFLRSVLFFLIVFTISHGQESNPTNITIDRDGTILQGKFYTSEGNGKFPTVIILHGFPGGEGDVFGKENLILILHKKTSKQHMISFTAQRILLNLKSTPVVSS